jgi:hypothetical protein
MDLTHQEVCRIATLYSINSHALIANSRQVGPRNLRGTSRSLERWQVLSHWDQRTYISSRMTLAL